MCTIEPICFTAQTHVNDLHDMSTNSKDNDDNSGVIIIGDNGPDYAPKSNKVFLNCSHLVKSRRLDYLVLCTRGFGTKFDRVWLGLSKPIHRWCNPRSLPGKNPPEERKSKDGLTDNS